MHLSSARDNLRELRAMQNKDKIYAPEEFTLHGAFFCLLFYSATAQHELDTKCPQISSLQRSVSCSLSLSVLSEACFLYLDNIGSGIRAGVLYPFTMNSLYNNSELRLEYFAYIRT